MAKLRTPAVTHETMAEYKAYPKDRQTDIKDVGGAVFGFLKGGTRSAGSVVSRSMIALDYDEFDADHLRKLRETLRCRWAIHSTHKHTEEAWRVRIIIPADRDMSPDEYVAVARKKAAQIGFEGIDKSTFEPSRLMFWPSKSKDAPYLFEESAYEELLNVENVLSLYHDWRDMSEWPLLPEEERLVGMADERTAAGVLSRGLGKGRPQEDPLEKKGIVGQFCRCYSIDAAVEKFLPDVYRKGTRNRYTYTGGTTNNGAVVYDGRFLFSNHATDPCGGVLCNAWDLVRGHLFRHLDSKSATNPTRLPSYKAMQELAESDQRFRTFRWREMHSNAEEEFADIDIPEEDLPGDDLFMKPWEEKIDALPKSKSGWPVSSITAVGTILRVHPCFTGKIRMNDLRKDIDVTGSLPWRRESVAWSNNDSAYLRAWLDRNYSINGKDKISDALKDVANENGFHPVRDFLESLKWDGEKRLERLIIDVMGAEDTELNRTLTKLMFVAAVRRVRRPGCKYDYFVILKGPEGCGKSSLFSMMGGQWFTDSIKSVEGKEAMIQLQGSWIIEIGELIGVKKSAVESVKAFISSQVDRFRPAYGEKTEEYPRQCVMFGTTNEEHPLSGFTGNRRQPVIEVNPELRSHELTIWDYLERYRDQLWAEACELEKTWGPLCLPPDLEAEARKIGEKFNRDLQNPLLPEIQDYLDTWVPIEWDSWDPSRRSTWLGEHKSDFAKEFDGSYQRDTICIAEILQEKLGVLKSNKDYYTKSRELGHLMKRFPEWEQAGGKRVPFYGYQKCWRRAGLSPGHIDPGDLY